MKKLMATFAATATLTTGAAVLTAPAAQAATISGSAVKYVFCSDRQYNNEIDYYDRYGKVNKYVTLNNADGNAFCGAIEVSIESDSYVWASISNDDATYTYVAIYNVYYPLFSGSTGAPPQYTLVARDEDHSRYGSSFAMAY
ncbi:hypothetical protein [Rhodococcus sp. NPDC003383]